MVRKRLRYGATTVAKRWAPLTQPVATSNRLAWSPDGGTMYHADTEQRTIWAYHYDPVMGVAQGQRVFARVDVDDGGPGRGSG
jgi:sugar lactone lactonase YvrE